jgi:dolichyl-phosphate-mannose--protein O-mannosyl transferase
MDVLDVARPQVLPHVPPEAAGPSRSWSRALRASVLVPIVLVLLAGGIRVWGLSSPSQTYWDESYYVPDAYDYLGGGYLVGHGDDPSDKLSGEITWVHPPLGKWMIATGVGPLGLRPLGWRLPSAVFGTAAVLLVYLLALALWGSVWWAGLAGLLLSLDGLHIVQSRMATLDVFLATFVLAGVYLAVLDRRASRRRAEGGRPVESGRRPSKFVERTFGTEYRLGSGLMLGAAVATKWSGLFALVFVAALSAQSIPRDGRRLRTIVASFVVVPLMVYLASYLVWFGQNGLDLSRFAELQWRMLQHQLHHGTVQPENSSPLSWPFLTHPIRYYPPPGPRVGTGGEIWLIGNPVLWWGFLAATPLLAVKATRGRWKEIVILGTYLALFAPWIFLARTQFLFYMLPAVPYMCLGMVAALRALPGRLRVRSATAFTALACVAAAAYLPVWLGLNVQWFRLPLLS